MTLFFLGIFISWILAEVTELVPTFSLWLVRRIAALLPETSEEIYSNEWQQQVERAPGKWWKLGFALGFMIKFFSVRRAAQEHHAWLVQKADHRTRLVEQIQPIVSAVPSNIAYRMDRMLKITEKVSDGLKISELDKIDLQLAAILDNFSIMFAFSYEDEDIEKPKDFQQFMGWGKVPPGTKRIHVSTVPEEIWEIVVNSNGNWTGKYAPDLRIHSSKLARLLRICLWYERFTANAWPDPKASHAEAIKNLKNMIAPELDKDLVTEFEKYITDPQY